MESTERLIESLQQPNPEKFTPKELYRLGCVLHQLDVVHAEASTHDLQSAYHQLLRGLPQRIRYFDALHTGMEQLLQQESSSLSSSSSSSSSVDNEREAMQALDALYQYSNLAQASTTCTTRTVTALAQYYDNHPNNQQSLSPILCSLLFRILWQSPSHLALELDELLPVWQVLQEHHLWEPLANYLDENTSGWQEALLEGYADETQRDYLASWLQSATSSEPDEDVQALAQAIAQTQISSQRQDLHKKIAVKSNNSNDPETMIQRQLDQVRTIFPQYGEGFVELALAASQWNVEQAVGLLSSAPTEWPAALQAADPGLPRRHQKRVEEQDAVATERTKQAVRAADAQQEWEAQVLARFGEYDDDYDDQWDEEEPAVHDGGLYDDFESVRAYNRVVRETESEMAFWEANANPNQRGSRAPNGGGYRGPDKLKGGRIPKPPPGGSGGGPTKEEKDGGDKTNNNQSSDKQKDDTKANGGKGSSNKSNADKGKKDNKKKGDTKATSAKSGKPPAAAEGKPSRGALRAKERKISNRREKQRQAMNKRSGG